MALGSGQFKGQRAVKPHLTRGTGGIAGEIADLRDDIARDLAANAALAVEEFTAVRAADTDGILTSQTTADAAAVFQGADLDGLVGSSVMIPPRNITVTTSDSAGTWDGDLTVFGKDANGENMEEALTLDNDTTVVGAKAFAQVTRIEVDAQNDDSGTYTVGFGDMMGLGKPLVSRAGLEAVLYEIEDGSMVTTGTFEDAATNPPNGTYDAANAPDDTRSYALYYEYDASLNR